MKKKNVKKMERKKLVMHEVKSAMAKVVDTVDTTSHDVYVMSILSDRTNTGGTKSNIKTDTDGKLKTANKRDYIENTHMLGKK